MKTQPDIVNAYPLYEGTFSVGTDSVFHRIGRGDPPAKGALKVSINPFLVTSGERKYLFDAGLGDFGEDTSTDIIRENLAEHGLSDYEITDIVCSHLHFDHIGGLAGRSSGFWELTFPDANVWVSRKGWEKALEKYEDDKIDFIHFLDAKANLHFFEDTDQPYPELNAEEVGGHTEFSQVLWFDDGQSKLMMAGDVLALRGEVNRKFAAKYDFEPKQSIKIRRRILKKAYEEEYTILGYHDSHHPVFYLADYNEDHGYTIEEITADVPS